MKKFTLLSSMVGIFLFFQGTMSAQVSTTITTTGTVSPGSVLAGSPYASLADAIAALNTVTSLTGTLTLTCAGGSETAPAGGYAINFTATTSATDNVVLLGSSSTITAFTPQTSGALNDAIFKIIGSDWVTIRNFTMQENPSNTTTTAGTNNMTEFGVALFYATTTNGAQNCTILNNTISLVRTYQNTFGIYSNSTHSATAVSTSATATTTAGGNSGLAINGNNISAVNNGILIVGPTAAADANTGIDIGGFIGNTITNYGSTGTFSSYANVSLTVFGVLVRNSKGFTISNNSITSSVGGTTSGTLRGIFNPSASATPTGTFTNNINDNTIALTYGVSTGTMQGIAIEGTNATTTSTQNINNNNFTTLTASITSSVVISAISTVAPHSTLNVSNNTFTNITTNTTGNFTFIAHSYTMPAGGSQTINNNSIVTAFSKTGAGGTVTCTTSGASSPNGTTSSTTNNNFSNITVTGTTGITGTLSNDGSGTSPAKTFSGNTYSNWTAGTGSILGFSINYVGATTTSISNNTLTNITGQGAITVISVGNTFAGATPLNISNNTINNVTSTGTGGNVVGISCSNASPTVNINGNTINTLSSTGTTSTVSGISGGATTTYNIFKNKIYDLSGNQAGSIVNGINITAGTTMNIYNNLIGDLRATAATGLNAINGINASATATYNVYYNTICLNATSSSATTFGNSCITFSSTVTAFNSRNNILVNTSTPAQNGSNLASNGIAACLRRSGGTTGTVPANYATTSNNNAYWSNPTAGTNNHLAYVEGTATVTNPKNTVADVKTFMVNRDQASVEENVAFLSTTGSSADFHKYNTATPSLLESGAANIATFTDDYTGTTRQGNGGYAGTGTAPDIGGWELEGTSIGCLASVGGTITPSTASRCVGTTYAMSTTGASSGSGITYQWEVSTVGGGVGFSDVTGGTGATTTSYTTGTLVAGTFYYRLRVTCNNGPIISYSNELTLTVNAIPTVAVTPTTGSICSPGGSPVALAASGADTYAWSPTTGLTPSTGANVSANPTTSTTYTVTGTTTATGCTNTATAVITISPVPTAITITPSAPTICTGTVQLLTATGGGPNDVIGSGTGFVGATSQPTAFCNRFAEYIGQQIYTAAELTAAGYVAGNLTSIAFNVSSLGDAATNNNYEIQIGHIGSTSTFPSTSFLSTAGYTSVYGPVTHTHTASGWQVINFSTPFNWNGTDNICVHMTHDGIDAINNAQTQFTTTAGNTTLTFVSSTPGASSTTGTLSTSRLNVRFTPVSSFPITWAPTTGLFTDMAATVPYTGTATTTVYASPSATQAYTVTATNGSGCTTTSGVTVTVSSGAAISTQPATQATCTGQTVNFTVVATGAGLTYQWRKGGSPLSDGGSISGATTATLTITGAVAGDAGSYDVIVTSTCGSPVTSSAATLTVNSLPAVAVTPTSATICMPGATPVALNASGASTYAWSPSTGLSANTGASVNANPSASTTYTVTGTDMNGCTNTATSVITVNQAITTTATATPSSVCNGDNSQLNVTVNGLANPIQITEVTLFRTGTGQTVTYPAYAVGADLVEVSNLTASPIDISGWTLEDYASNATTPTHTALTFPSGTIIPANGVSVVCLGTGTDDIPNRYFNTGGTSDFWSSGSLVGIVLKNGSTVIDAVGLNSGYVFNAATGVIASDWSGFALSGSGFAGTIRSAATDTNAGSNWSQSSLAVPQTIGTYNGGYTTPASVSTYAWTPATFLSSTSIANPIATAVTATTAYNVVVTTTAGCTSSSDVTVTVVTGAGITTQPSPQAKCEGATATFNVVATGPSLTYQWRKGGTPLVDGGTISGATTATLTIAGVLVADAGSYDVIVSSSCGSPVTSSAAALTVETTIPTAVITPSETFVCGTGSVVLTASGAGMGGTYAWAPNATLSAIDIAAPTATPLATTTYIVTVTNAGGCSASTSQIIDVFTLPNISVTPATATIDCGDTQAITVSETGQANLYSFTATAPPAAFTPLSGSTAVDIIEDDDVLSGTIPIGFNFKFEGTSYSNVKASSNGWLSFNPAAASSVFTNSTTAASTVLPLIAPLWDDLDGFDFGGAASYLTTGTAPNRVFTFEWLNWEWRYDATGAVISFQVKLYETSNRIELIYKQEAGTEVTTSASIGIMTSSTNYKMLDGTGPSPNALTNTFTTTLSTKPATDQIYRFDPPVSDYLWSPTTNLFTDMAATIPYTNQDIATVYAKPTANTTYTVTATNASGCTASSSSVITLGTGCETILNLSGTRIEGYMDPVLNRMRSVMLLSGVVGATATQCDTIHVELHNPTPPYALAFADTIVLDTNGTAACSFPAGATGNSYYIVIKGRNFVETWSATTPTFTATTSFNLGAVGAFGGNLGTFGSFPVIYSGDMEAAPFGDGNVDLLDYAPWEIEYNNFSSGYFKEDLNGDGNVDLIDFAIWEINYNNFISALKP